MTWAVIHGDDSWSDLERLASEDRSAVEHTLIEWVASGPARARERVIADITVYEHHLEGGVAITYFVDEDQHLIGLLRNPKTLTCAVGSGAAFRSSS